VEQHPKIQTTPEGTLLLNFGDYGQQVDVAAISGDGRRVLTVRDVGTAQIWDAASGEQIGELRPDSPLCGTTGTAPMGDEFEVFIEAAALDRDGSTALLGLNDGTAGIFRVADGSRLATLHPPGKPPATEWGVIRAVAYSPDGTLALVGFPGRAVGVWSALGDRLVAFLAAPAGSKLVGRPFVRDSLVTAAAASADGRWVFAGCMDGTATIWELSTGEVVLEALEHAEDVLAVFDHDGDFGWATTGGSVWLSRGGSEAQKVLATGEHWAEVAIGRGEVLARGFRGEVTRWSLAGERTALCEPAEAPRMWSDRAVSLALRGTGDHFYPESGQRLAVSTGGQRTAIERSAQIVTARFAPRGDAVAIAGWTDAVELWAVPGGEIVRSFASPGGVGAFAFSEDGALLAVGEIGHGGGRYPRHVTVYETATGRQLVQHADHDWQVSHVALSPDARWLASIGDELVLRDLHAGPESPAAARAPVQRSTAGLRFLRDGRLLVVDQERARVFRGAAELLCFEVPIGFETRWCVGDDDRTLDVAIGQGLARFELDTGRLLGAWTAPIPRPEPLPSRQLARQAALRAGAMLWRTPHGTFLHLGDGPRGWIDRLQLSAHFEVAIPAGEGAALVVLAPEPTLLGMVPFEGKLRASLFLEGEVLLVNHAGQLFRSALPHGAPSARS
jgi:WD40 repeat protein